MNMTTFISQLVLFFLSQATIKLKIANFTAYGRIITHYKSFCVVLSLKKCIIYKYLLVTFIFKIDRRKKSDSAET